MWCISWLVSLLLLVSSVAYVVMKIVQKKAHESGILVKLMIFVFLANTVIFWPIVSSSMKTDIGWQWGRYVKTFFVAMHHSLRLFVVDGEFDIIRYSVPTANRALYSIYSVHSAILYIISPALTFGYLFSFIRNFFAEKKLKYSLKKDLAIFSDFNEESITLASAIFEKGRIEDNDAFVSAVSEKIEIKKRIDDILDAALIYGACYYKENEKDAGYEERLIAFVSNAIRSETKKNETELDELAFQLLKNKNKIKQNDAFVALVIEVNEIKKKKDEDKAKAFNKSVQKLIKKDAKNETKIDVLIKEITENTEAEENKEFVELVTKLYKCSHAKDGGAFATLVFKVVKNKCKKDDPRFNALVEQSKKDCDINGKNAVEGLISEIINNRKDKNSKAFSEFIANTFPGEKVDTQKQSDGNVTENKIRGKQKKKDIALVFTECPEEDNVSDSVLKEQAKKINAILFSKDLFSVDLKWHKNNKITFYVFGKDENKNVKTALTVIDKYKARDNTKLYVLSNEPEGELLLNAAMAKAEKEMAQPMENNGAENKPETDEGNATKKTVGCWKRRKKAEPTEPQIVVRRINHIQKTVFDILEHGAFIFDQAKEGPFAEKAIGAVIVGLGKYGSEMTKSLAWFGQMEGYRLTIDAFDSKPNAEDLFAETCPELMDKVHNGDFEDFGESRYKITVHQDKDVFSASCETEIRKLTNATYVFVALGNDEKNVQAAVHLRRIFERMGIHPHIQAIVMDAEQKKALGNIANEKGIPYDIECVGCIDDVFSFDSILNPELELEALRRHLCWSTAKTVNEDTKKFWKYNYNYSSSMASAMHKRMKIHCKIQGIKKAKADRTEAERQTLRKMEHRRWNAYMRSQGYVYAPTRNDLAKTHPCLVTFDKLPLSEQEKDDD